LVTVKVTGGIGAFFSRRWCAGACLPAGRTLDMAAGKPATRRPDWPELIMGFFSWFRSRRIADDQDEQNAPHSLIRYRYEDPAFEETERAAAADVAAVEEDDKYFGPDAPAKGDEL